MARGELTLPGDERDQHAHRDEALAAFGLAPPEPGCEPERVFWLWPEHVQALHLWFAVQTQWRVAPMGGAIGLDYAGVEVVLRQRARTPRARRRLFAELQAMEAGALEAWAEQREQREQRRH